MKYIGVAAIQGQFALKTIVDIEFAGPGVDPFKKIEARYPAAYAVRIIPFDDCETEIKPVTYYEFG